MRAKGIFRWVTVAAVMLLTACPNPFTGDDPDGPATPTPANPPEAPALLAPVDGAADTGILVTLDWEASAGAQSYDVFLETDSSPATLAPAGDDIVATQLDVSGLSYSTTYYWFVRVENAEGTIDSEIRSFATGAAPTSPPGQVSGPSPADEAVDVSPDITLEWSSATGAESYNLYLGIGSLPGSATVTGITGTSHDPGTLTLDADYHWRIDAVNSEGTTAGPEWTFTVADAASLAPVAPSSVAATVSGTSGSDTIDLTWTDNSTTETGFEIERSEDGGSTWSGVTTTGADATAYSNSGLEPDTSYRFRVRAHNAFAESSWVGNDSNATATTDASPFVYASWDTGNDTTGSGTAANPYASVTKALAEAVAGQTIRVAGTTGSEEYLEAPMTWKGEVSLEGGWSPDLSTHAPSTYKTVVRANIAAGTEYLININLVSSSISSPIVISHVTLINHRTTNSQDPVVRISNVTNVTLDTVVLEADGPVSANALFVGGTADSDIVVRDSTIRTLDIPTLNASDNWAYGIVADNNFGSLVVENTDITVNAASIAAAVKQNLGDLTITGGSLTNAATTERSSSGVWVFGGNSFIMDGVTVITSDSNTENSAGVLAYNPVQTVFRVLNSDFTIGEAGGGSYDIAVGIRVSESGSETTVRGNTVRFDAAKLSNSGDFIGIEIDGTAGGSEVRIDRNTISFGPNADGTEIIGIDIVDVTSGAANVADPLEVTNNLIYREDGNDAYFSGVFTNLTSSTTQHDILLANNTIVSLDTGNSTGAIGITLETGSGTEIVNNLILTGAETSERYGVWVRGGDLPARLEGNSIDAEFLFDGRTSIADLNDASLVTFDTGSDGSGDGIATGNVTGLTTGFADAANGDFDLTASSAASLRTGGADLSSVFDADIDGVERSTGGTNGTNWSIGAFEY